MAIKIGQKVRVKDWDDIPERLKNEVSDDLSWGRGRAKVCGQTGRVVDVIYSNLNKQFVYRFRADGSKYVSHILFDEECFDIIYDGLRCNIFRDGERVYAQIVNADGVALRSAYGYIKNDTELGFVQAASYALKRLYEEMREAE